MSLKRAGFSAEDHSKRLLNRITIPAKYPAQIKYVCNSDQTC